MTTASKTSHYETDHEGMPQAMGSGCWLWQVCESKEEIVVSCLQSCFFQTKFRWQSATLSPDCEHAAAKKADLLNTKWDAKSRKQLKSKVLCLAFFTFHPHAQSWEECVLHVTLLNSHSWGRRKEALDKNTTRSACFCEEAQIHWLRMAGELLAEECTEQLGFVQISSSGRHRDWGQTWETFSELNKNPRNNPVCLLFHHGLLCLWLIASAGTSVVAFSSIKRVSEWSVFSSSFRALHVDSGKIPASQQPGSHATLAA